MSTQVSVQFEKRAQVEKVDDELGLVFGWAIVCTENGEPYFDTQGDHIPEDAMLKAALDFMSNSRTAKAMHDGQPVGDIVFAMPMTTALLKASGMPTSKTGLMIAMRPSAEVLDLFKSGKYTGFSIGGRRVKDEDVDDKKPGGKAS